MATFDIPVVPLRCPEFVCWWIVVDEETSLSMHHAYGDSIHHSIIREVDTPGIDDADRADGARRLDRKRRRC